MVKPYNCDKHGRLIIATLAADTDGERKYCIECIEELEDLLMDVVVKYQKLINQIITDEEALDKINDVLKFLVKQ